MCDELVDAEIQADYLHLNTSNVLNMHYACLLCTSSEFIPPFLFNPHPHLPLHNDL